MTLTRFFPVVCAAISTLFLSLSLKLSAAEAPNQLTLSTNWHDLFNGGDLTGWDKHLSRSDGKDIIPNEDRKNVFTVTNLAEGAAIHVSGEVYGAITTQSEFENFHFRVEFKWGEKRWPARQNVARDTGILYCCVGKPNPGTGWMTSVENNIMEKGVGQWWSVNGAVIDVEGELIKPEMELYIPYKKEGSSEQNLVWRRGFPLITAQPHNGITPPFDTEYVFGNWNTVEVIFWAGNCIHVLNGVPNLVAVNPRHKVNDRWHPLERGKIQLQSEAAEVFYRKPQIRLVTEIPREYLELIPSPVKPTAGDEGFKKLFQGEDVITWKQAGPGKFTLENGIATGSGGMGLWWFSDRQYGEFILRGEFLQEQEAADSGIFLRFPDPGNDPWVAVKHGHEIELGDPKAGNPTWHTGSIYPFQAPVENASKPPGEWNEYEIIARDHNYSVRLNGKLVTTWTDPERRSTNGFIGLQNYDDGKPSGIGTYALNNCGRLPHRSPEQPKPSFARGRSCAMFPVCFGFVARLSSSAPEKTASFRRSFGLSGESPLLPFAPFVMKADLHPKYQDSEIRCACGNVIKTRSTKPVVIIGICNACHPFYTGTQKFVDTAGRVDKFQQRLAKTQAAQAQAAENAANKKKRK